MKGKKHKILKACIITLCSILGLALVAVLLLSWTILSPARLTDTARMAMDRYVPCPTRLDRASLTLVRTFPFVGVRIEGMTAFDTAAVSPTDTLAYIDVLDVTANLKEYLKTRHIEINGLLLDGVRATLCTGADGSSNLDMFRSNEAVASADTSATDSSLSLCLESLEARDLAVSYNDLQSGINASLSGLNLTADGCMLKSDIDAGISLFTNGNATAHIHNDSVSLDAVLESIGLECTLKSDGSGIEVQPKLSAAGASLSLNGMSAGVNALGLEINKLTINTLDGKFSSAGCNAASIALDGAEFSLKMAPDSILRVAMQTTEVIVPQAIYNTVDTTLSAGHSTLSIQGVDACMLADGQDSPWTAFQTDRISLEFNGNASANIDNLTENLILTLSSAHFAMTSSNQSFDTGMDSLRFSIDSKIGTDSMDIEPMLTACGLSLNVNGETLIPGWPVSMASAIKATRNLSQTTAAVQLDIDGQKLMANVDAQIPGGNTDHISCTANVNIKTIDLQHIISMVPAQYRHYIEGISATGKAGIKADVKGQIDYGRPLLSGAVANVSLDDVDATLFDSICVQAQGTYINASYPSARYASRKEPTADVNVQIGMLEAVIDGSSSPYIAGGITGADISMAVSGTVSDSIDITWTSAGFLANTVKATYDTIGLNVENLSASAAVENTGGPVGIEVSLGMDALNGRLSDLALLSTNRTSVTATASYDSSKEGPLLRWSPNVNAILNEGRLLLNRKSGKQEISLPRLDMDFSLGHFVIYDSRVQAGNSDIALTGEVYNIGAFIEKTAPLTGKLYLESDYVDINEILAMTSGIGSNETSASIETAQVDVDTVQVDYVDTAQVEPFVVPRGIDLAMHTNFSRIRWQDSYFQNVGGDVTVKDGKAILQELGFSSNAAQMQLTAVYRSPHPDSLFTELDFHLLDIEIGELIDLIPSVDSVVPMLKSFDGLAQFHFAAETYLHPNYTPVMSTLMGAAAIEGSNLVVMDNDVFNGVKRKLLMSRKARNMIDSLDVELTVLSNKVTLYPFRIGMDRYQAVIGGRHNINRDMDCRYHISLVETPLPIRLGVTIEGPVQEIAAKPLKHIKLQRPEYSNIYVPEKRSDLEDKVLWLKNDILETLRSNVR